MRPCRHRNLQCMFHSPFIHALFFVSGVCSGVPGTCSGIIPVVFQQNFFLKPSVLRTTMRKTTNLKIPAGCPRASKRHTFLSCVGGLSWGASQSKVLLKSFTCAHVHVSQASEESKEGAWVHVSSEQSERRRYMGVGLELAKRARKVHRCRSQVSAASEEAHKGGGGTGG